MVFLAKPIVAELVKEFPAFMKPDDLLPYSQQPLTGPYSEPHKISLCPSTPLF
jgi:hypothetical protein